MKGIIFRPNLIKAIAEDDREWMTRRVIKQLDPEFEWEVIDVGEPIIMFKDGIGGCIFLSSRYQVGETVYIKEAHYRYGEWRKNGLTKTGRQKWLFHPMPEMLTISTIKGIESLRYFDNPPDEVKPNSYRKEGWYKRSPLFMPEWAARYFEKITDIRAERLQEITEEDVLAEGITVMRGTWQSKKWNEKTRKLELTGERYPYTGHYHFEVIWDSINPKYLWGSNPWVFVYSFKKAEK